MKLICINDTNRPKEIPKSKWVVLMEEYTPIRICRMAKQNDILGVEFAEICLDETNEPFEFFRLDRFAFNQNDLNELKDLIAMTNERDELVELLKEQLTEIE